MPRIFVSHATSDGANAADALVSELETLGRACWIAPRDVVAGRTYAAQILDAIENSDAVALVLTPAANTSRDVAQEVQIAHAREKTIVPLVMDRTVPAGDLAYFLALRHQVHWISPGEAASAVLKSVGGQSVTGPNVAPAASAVAAAASSESGITGIFEMTVRSTDVDDGGHWLNSEPDYRDPLNLGVALSETVAQDLMKHFGRSPVEALSGRKIRVSGTALRKRIDFVANGQPTGHYYFQTHLAVTDPGQITVL